MTTIEVRLPEDLEEAVNEQIASGRYSDGGEYILNLIRKDHERLEQERLEALLASRLREPSMEVDDSYFNNIRQRLQKEIDSRRQP